MYESSEQIEVPSDRDVETQVLELERGLAAPPAPDPQARGRRRPWGRGGARRAGSVDVSGSNVLRGFLGGTQAAELRAEAITAWFGDRKVLDRVSLTMPAGQVTALIGPSGCGKSTFLRILNRMHELIPSASLAGQVVLDGQDIYAPGQRVTDARKKIGMVFQKPNPFPAMSIYENTVAALDLTGTKASREERDFLVEESLKKASLWDEVKDRLHQPGGGLSGGQQQRLCIARAMALTPEILLMDEPASALDPSSTRRIEETIADLRGEVTIVIVTHNMQQAHRISDQCAFFLAEHNAPGVIVEYGDTEAIFSNPRDQRTDDYVNGRFG
ncbi:MAG: phosphate ABC transporter ATP-binding protein [Nocardioidaceae bacterium]|nr:phosphate ABC transporter ATP-binding protein [Nocardioidaceae bacterium]